MIFSIYLFQRAGRVVYYLDDLHCAFLLKNLLKCFGSKKDSLSSEKNVNNILLP